MNITVLGAGAWGSAMATQLVTRHTVCLWARDVQLVQALRSTGMNHRYLPSIPLPTDLRFESDLAAALRGVDLIIVAVSTGGFREVLTQIKNLGVNVPVVWLCKGFEQASGLLAHQVFDQVLKGVDRGVLSGPSFSLEVAHNQPTALTLASDNTGFVAKMAPLLHGGSMRVYSSEDLIGVEVAGAVKNVVAIATGVCDGLQLGLNARAALMTRGLAEMTRLGVSLGGRAETFMGLAGVGDLILTCTGDLSRNRQVGLGLARGEALKTLLNQLGHVAEGVSTSRIVLQWATKNNVEMPITQAVCRVLDAPDSARQVARELLDRHQRME